MLALAMLCAMPGSALAQSTEASESIETGDNAADFADWLRDLRREARGRGISEGTLDVALTGVAPIARVLELDRKQPEFTRTLWDYMAAAVSDTRIAKGREMLRAHEALLAAIEREYQVQPRFLVAFWGLETNFGQYTGGFPVIDATATLAHDARRSDFFRAQLLHALGILEAGHIPPEQMQGSWAGAMGQLQFMPSTFVRHAVDRDGDGRKDIWGSLPDVFASAANYLAAIGWNGARTWGREVRLPPEFDLELTGLGTKRTLAEWQEAGVRRADGRDLPQVPGMKGSVIVPAGYAGPAFLVYENFRAIMDWNRSILYALAVGHLADRLQGGGPLKSRQPAGHEAMRRADINALQELLNRLGYDAGVPDGYVGPRTRKALKAYQKAAGLPADGYPTAGILQRLQTGTD